jgi:DNA-binding MarR family transcriptional regulator
MESTLVEIIKLYELFESENKSDVSKNNVLNFIAFLKNKVEVNSQNSEKYEGWRSYDRQTLMGMVIAYIGKMGRYADNYSRKAMSKTPLGSIEEFTYTIPLLQDESLTKSELIHKNGHAITTGTEIIKRLLKKKILTQFPDEKDKRSMRVKLTDSGKTALFASMPVTKNIATLATGILSNEELMQLLSTLKKLDVFHDNIHRNSKNIEVDELINLPEIKKSN